MFEPNLYTNPLCTPAYHVSARNTQSSRSRGSRGKALQHFHGCLSELAASKRGGAADKTQLHAVADCAEGASSQQIPSCSGRLQHITKEVRQASPSNTLEWTLQNRASLQQTCSLSRELVAHYKGGAAGKPRQRAGADSESLCAKIRTWPQAQVADTALDVLVLWIIQVPVHVLRRAKCSRA